MTMQLACFSHAPLLLKCERRSSLGKMIACDLRRLSWKARLFRARLPIIANRFVLRILRIPHVRVDKTIYPLAFRLNRFARIIGGFSVGELEILWKRVEIRSDSQLWLQKDQKHSTAMYARDAKEIRNQKT
jgi:hypothetical protein